MFLLAANQHILMISEGWCWKFSFASIIKSIKNRLTWKTVILNLANNLVLQWGWIISITNVYIYAHLREFEGHWLHTSTKNHCTIGLFGILPFKASKVCLYMNYWTPSPRFHPQTILEVKPWLKGCLKSCLPPSHIPSLSIRS